MKKGMGLGTKMTIISFVVIILSSAALGIFSSALHRSDTVQARGELARSIAMSMAASIDAEEFESIMESGEKNDYYAEKKDYIDTLLMDNNLTYLYVLDAAFDQDVTYFMEGAHAETTDAFDLFDTDPAEVYGPDMLAEVSEGSTLISPIYDSGEYGVMITGFAPVKDDAGHTVAIVGADISVDQVMAESDTFIRNMAVIALLCALIFGFVIRTIGNGLLCRPIVELSSFLHHIGSKGTSRCSEREMRTIKRNETRTDEIGQAYQSFSLLLARFEQLDGRFQAVAQGDLTQEVPVLSEEDTLGLSLNKVIDSLNRTFGSINGTSLELANVSQGIADSSISLAQGVTEQTSAVLALSTAIGDVAQETDASARQARYAAQLGERIKENAELGSQKMDHMLDAVGQITKASSAIGNVIRVIDDIAFQTNILALNAAVEAARAGQHGKGFAVVADEVRNLAAKSAAAAKETGILIEDSIQKAALGAKIAEETAKSLGDIVSGINESSEIIHQIATSSEEQTRAIRRLSAGAEEVGEVVGHISKGAEVSSEASSSMSRQSSDLYASIAYYKTRGRAQRPARR